MVRSLRWETKKFHARYLTCLESFLMVLRHLHNILTSSLKDAFFSQKATGLFFFFFLEEEGNVSFLSQEASSVMMLGDERIGTDS